MHRKTLAAVVLSLCTAGAVAPTIATAAAGPAVAPAAAITDGTSNTIVLADSTLRLEPGSNELVVTSFSGNDVLSLRAALATDDALDTVTLVTRTQTAVLEGASLTRLMYAGSSPALSINFTKLTYVYS